jgi:hypothetical protein
MPDRGSDRKYLIGALGVTALANGGTVLISPVRSADLTGFLIFLAVITAFLGTAMAVAESGLKSSPHVRAANLIRISILGLFIFCLGFCLKDLWPDDRLPEVCGYAMIVFAAMGLSAAIYMAFERVGGLKTAGILVVWFVAALILLPFMVDFQDLPPWVIWLMAAVSVALLCRVPAGRMGKTVAFTTALLSLVIATAVIELPGIESSTDSEPWWTSDRWVGAGSILFTCGSLMSVLLMRDVRSAASGGRLLWWTLFGALSGVALTAVVLVFIPGAWQGASSIQPLVIYTLCVTPICTLLLMLSVVGWSEARRREASWLAAGLVVVAAVMSLAAIWPVCYNGRDPHIRADEQVPMLILFGLPAILFVQYRNRGGLRFACLLGLLISILLFALGRFLIIVETDGDLEGYVSNMLVAALSAAPLLVAASIGWRSKWQFGGWAGLAVGLTAMVYLMNTDWDSSARQKEVTAIVVLLAILAAHPNVVLRLSVGVGQTAMAWGTIILIPAIGAGVLLGIPPNQDQWDYIWQFRDKLTAAGGIVWACATMALIVATPRTRS